MEELRKQVREMRRRLVALSDATGATRSASADVQFAACWVALLRMEREAGIRAPAVQGLPEVLAA